MEFFKPLSDAHFNLRNLSENEGVPIIERDTETLLAEIIRTEHPVYILEIGTAVGYSAAFFALTAEKARVVTVESDERMYEKAVFNMASLGLTDRVKIIHGDALEVIKGDLAAEKFDFVFIDAAKSRYKEFFEVVLEVASTGAVIISDNVLLKGTVSQDEKNVRRRNRTSLRKMKEYISYLESVENADTSIIKVGDGLALTVLLEKK